MNVSFRKSDILVDGGVCLSLGDGVNRHINAAGAKSLLDQLKSSLGIEDAHGALLAALRAAVQHDGHDEDGISAVWLEDALAAIRKAEGEVG